jgi:hypothetical protein
MYNLKPKIFFCYTTRDKEIDLLLLTNLKKNLNLLNLFYTYIDLIDNNKSINPQQNVIKNLKSSDILCIINTPNTHKSPWVKKEIYYANKHNIPIIKIELTSIYNFVNIDDKTQLLYNQFIITLIQTVLHNK